MRRPALTQLLLSAEGRLGRGVFWVVGFSLLLLLTLFDMLAPQGVQRWIAWAVHAALFVCAACVIAKRLHDRGHAGWWGAMPLLAFCVAWMQPNPLTKAVAAFALLWALGVLKGKPGWNRFGPEPGA